MYVRAHAVGPPGGDLPDTQGAVRYVPTVWQPALQMFAGLEALPLWQFPARRGGLVKPQMSNVDPVATIALCAWLRKQIKIWESDAKAALSMLPGERLTAAIDKKPLGFVTLAQGKRSTHVDEDAFTDWVAQRYPTEIVKTVRPAFRKKLLDQALSRGAVVDGDGEVCDAVTVSRGTPYPTCQLSDEADITISALLSRGQLGVNGLKELKPVNAEPVDQEGDAL